MTPRADRWSGVRYRWLLPAAAADRRLGRAFAALAARVEFARDPRRSAAAADRIGRWLGLDPRRARLAWRGALVSEAREEADSAYFMRHPDELTGAFAGAGARREDGPAILATLHFGSPVLGFVHLRRDLALDVSIVARPLDAANPMPAAKARWARHKVAWTERVSGRPFLATDPASVARARAHLLDGGCLYTPIDVPGDVAGRSTAVAPFGEPVRIASGIEALARMTGCPIQPVAVLPRAAGFTFWYGRRIASSATRPFAEAIDELGHVVRERPEQWWMWPYLVTSRGSGGESP